MSRLTTFSKILLGLIFLAALYFAAKYFMGDNLSVPKIKIEQESEPKKEANTTNDEPSGQQNSTFNYSPKSPVGGKLMGVVELGASGFNSFIIRKDNNDNWAKEKYEWGNSLVIDGMASGKDIISGLKEYISNILDYGVDGKNIHFVVSSGAKKEEKIQAIIKAIREIGYIANEDTAEQEGLYALKAALPKEYENQAFVLDIGSGNTKLSYIGNNRVQAFEGPGAKYYKKNTSDVKAFDEIYKIGQKVPSDLSTTCFIIGGVPFQMAKEVRQGKERFTVLNSPNRYTDLAEKEGKKVQSGLNIYQGIYDATGCRKYVFDWDANFTIGFLLSLPG